MRDHWPDSLPLLDLNRRDRLRLRHLLENSMALGLTGSGKTSGPSQHELRALLALGAGVLILCVKKDAAKIYRQWIRAAGRAADLVEFGPGHEARFNILDYIPKKYPGDAFLLVEEILLVLSEALELVTRGQPDRQRLAKDNGFFRDAANKLLRCAILSLLLAKDRITIADLALFVSQAPRHLDDDRAARDNFAVQMVTKARQRLRAEGRPHVGAQIFQFLTGDWAGYAHDTREDVRITTQVLLDVLTHEPASSLFGSNTTVTADSILDGTIVLVTPAIHEQRALGGLCAAVWKSMTQRAVLARVASEDPTRVRPVVIVADEAHELVTPSDVRYVSSSRSLRGISCYATQTLTSLTETLGEAATATLLGGFRNRYICRTDDPATLRWIKESTNEVIDDDLAAPSPLNRVVDPATNGLRSLRQGGVDGIVEAIFIRGGDRFQATGRRWCRLEFSQRPPTSSLGRLWQYATTNEVRILPG